MLCNVCDQGVDLDAASSREGAFHHTSCGDLQAAASAGYPFCVEILREIREDEDSFNQFFVGCSQIKLGFSGEGYLGWSLDPSENGLHYRTSRAGVFYIQFADEAIAEYLNYKPLHYPAGSESFFELISTWMKTCSREHEVRSESFISHLPTRVLDVGSENTNPFLFESKGACGTWMTLSYCWGDTAPFRTTSANIKDRCRNITLAMLPLLFQDAIQVTRRLGYQYLWIDSLCIVQDSKEDWLRESSRMGYIFQNSALTLAAEAAMNSSFGLFQTTNEERRARISLPVFSGRKTSKELFASHQKPFMILLRQKDL